jgi:hypothetical protein
MPGEPFPGSQVLACRGENRKPHEVTSCENEEFKLEAVEAETLPRVQSGVLPPLYRPSRFTEVEAPATSVKPGMRRVVPQRGRSRQARGGCNTRVKGSRRSRTSGTSAVRGGDSGDSDPGSDPPARGGARVGRTSRILAGVVA